jgi:hypothetical protein
MAGFDITGLDSINTFPLKIILNRLLKNQFNRMTHPKCREDNEGYALMQQSCMICFNENLLLKDWLLFLNIELIVVH